MSDGVQVTLGKLPSLARSISPPTVRRRNAESTLDDSEVEPTLAAIEAGQAKVKDHLEYFSKHLDQVSRRFRGSRITIDDFRQLYQRNQHRHGHHFVVHQHDHPIAGIHYDLRLQFSESSSISFAVPYGLPGNPNSVRPNRLAIETRVHNLWNHLVESASHATGSLLIWDTGEYEVLDREHVKMTETDDEISDHSADLKTQMSESERLFKAFRSRHIRLRLNGSRLPLGYTVSLRLPYANSTLSHPRTPRSKRRRIDPSQVAQMAKAKTEPVKGDTSGSDDEWNTNNGLSVHDPIVDTAVASECEDENAAIQENNAYPGATNTIGSMHQRRWFLAMDRKGSGFYKACCGPDEGRWLGP